MSGDVIVDLNIFLSKYGYPRLEVGSQQFGVLCAMAQKVVAMDRSISEVNAMVTAARGDEAIEASYKTSDNLLGSAFNMVSFARKKSRAEAGVTSDNIRLSEKVFYAGIDYEKFVCELRGGLKQLYGQMRRNLIAHIDDCKISGWGSPAEMQAIVSKIDASEDVWTEEFVLARVVARPWDIEYAVRCMDHFGESVWELSKLAGLFGLDWNKSCSDYMQGMDMGIDKEDEDHLLVRRKHVEGMCTRLNGVQCVKELLARIDERLAAIDLEMRTVGDVVCTTREEAEKSRAEKSSVDEIIQGVKLFPLEVVDELIKKVESANFQTEYGKSELERLRNHRKYMLTVCGVVYETYDEAKAAFEEKCKSEGKISSFLTKQFANGFSKGEEAIRLARYWPGGVDPDSAIGKMKSGNVVGAVATASQVVGQELKSAAALAKGKLSSFFRKK